MFLRLNRVTEYVYFTYIRYIKLTLILPPRIRSIMINQIYYYSLLASLKHENLYNLYFVGGIDRKSVTIFILVYIVPRLVYWQCLGLQFFNDKVADTPCIRRMI